MTLETLKALVGIDGDSVSLDDTTTIAGLGKTAYEEYLDGLLQIAGETLAGWAGLSVEALPDTAVYRRSHVLVVQADIVMDHGVVTALAPEEIQAGGSTGDRIKFRRLNTGERLVEYEQLRRRAYRAVTGQEMPGRFEGVA